MTETDKKKVLVITGVEFRHPLACLVNDIGMKARAIDIEDRWLKRILDDESGAVAAIVHQPTSLNPLDINLPVYRVVGELNGRKIPSIVIQCSWFIHRVKGDYDVEIPEYDKLKDILVRIRDGA